MQVDVSTHDGQELVLSWLRDPRCIGAFLAPPCGTASRAKSIKLRDPSGRPILRTDRYPHGVPGLTGTNLLRVSKANVLYHFTARLIREALSLKLVCCENFKNSLFWQTNFISQLSHPDLQTQSHQACAYGSSRPKWTTLLFNHTSFSAISKVCPGESAKHRHAPCGLLRTGEFATAQETASKQLCKVGTKPPLLI